MQVSKYQVKQGVKLFNEHLYDPEQGASPIMAFSTTCCATTILSIKDYHTLAEIRDAVEWIKKDSFKQKWNVQDRAGGEVNLQVFISPGEYELENNLQKLKFNCINTGLKRRKGYPASNNLKLYMLTF